MYWESDRMVECAGSLTTAILYATSTDSDGLVECIRSLAWWSELSEVRRQLRCMLFHGNLTGWSNVSEVLWGGQLYRRSYEIANVEWGGRMYQKTDGVVGCMGSLTGRPNESEV